MFERQLWYCRCQVPFSKCNCWVSCYICGAANVTHISWWFPDFLRVKSLLHCTGTQPTQFQWHPTIHFTAALMDSHYYKSNGSFAFQSTFNLPIKNRVCWWVKSQFVSITFSKPVFPSHIWGPFSDTASQWAPTPPIENAFLTSPNAADTIARCC